MTSTLVRARPAATAAIAVAISTVFTIPTITHAQAPATTTTPTVIVSATRTAQTVDETLAPVSVITRDDIERLQATSIRDLLRGLPGVSVANQGGQGKLTSLFLRGAESDQVLVLVDGVKVGSATAGLFAFQDIPVEQIERIEVVRGPRASLYGSEAIGGVVQIFTRRGGGALRPSARVTVGSRRTAQASAGLSGGGERGWFNVTGAGASTDGFDACRNAIGGPCGIEPDADGYRNRSVSLRAGYRLTDSAEVEAFALATSAFTEFDGFFNQSENRQRIVGASAAFAPLDPWRVTVRAGRARDEGDSFNNGSFLSEFLTRRDSFSLQNDVEIARDHLVTAGFDWQRDGVDGTTAFAVRSRWNKAVFGQYQGRFGDHDLDLSLRHDRNQQFGTANTGSAAWGWRFHPAVRSVLSYGTAFKAPNFNELYFPGFSDPTLAPEESRTWELRFVGRAGRAQWSLGAFHTSVDDLIAASAPAFIPVNIGKVRIRGLEASLATTVLEFDVSASLTLLDARNRSAGANFDKQLNRRPRQVARVDVDRDLGRWRFGTTVVAEGHRFDDLANRQRIGGFMTVDLRTEYALARDWTAQARVENLLDKRYQTARFFDQPGRGVFFTLRYQPSQAP